MPEATPTYNPPDPTGVYFCPPCEKFEDLKDPPLGEKKALSYAGRDTQGAPVFWIYREGKWDERQALIVEGLLSSRNSLQRTVQEQTRTDRVQIDRELVVRFLDCVVEQWPEILERYRQRTDVPEFLRAAGDCICTICHQPYWKHEYDKRYPTPPSMWLRINRPEYFLHKLCDGTLVKL
jgi:hypothetical protein